MTKPTLHWVQSSWPCLPSLATVISCIVHVPFVSVSPKELVSIGPKTLFFLKLNFLKIFHGTMLRRWFVVIIDDDKAYRDLNSLFTPVSASTLPLNIFIACKRSSSKIASIEFQNTPLLSQWPQFQHLLILHPFQRVIHFYSDCQVPVDISCSCNSWWTWYFFIVEQLLTTPVQYFRRDADSL